MRNKISIVLAISIIALPFVGYCFYHLLTNLDSDKFLLSLAAFVCSLGAYALLLLTFKPKKNPTIEH
jgi:ABC-type Co2+ transport system permease subunit